MTEQQMKLVSVEDLFSGGKISKKTYNTLVRAGMKSLFDLKRYSSGMQRIFKSGASGVREIHNLLLEVDGNDAFSGMSNLLFPSLEPELSKGEQVLESLSDIELELLDIVYRNQISKMQNSRERTTTKIANALAPVPVSTFIRDFLYEDDERIMMLHEVGEISMPNVSMIKNVLLRVMEEMRQNDMPVEFRILRLEAEGMLDNDDFIKDYYVQYSRLPMMYLIQKFIIDGKDNPILKAFLQRYGIFDGKVAVDDEKIAKSSFTITTYSNNVFDALFTPGAPTEIMGEFMTGLLADDRNMQYLDDMVEDVFVDAEDEAIHEIISEEHLIMNPMCVLAIVGKLLHKRYTCFGGYTRSFGAAMDERWNHAYLVDKSLVQVFDFQKELWRFRDNIVRTSTERFAFDIDDYVKENVGDRLEDEQALAQIIRAFKTIVVDELLLEVDEDGYVMIPKRKDKSLADRLYDILDKEKQPMGLDQLTDCINAGDGRRYVRASVSLTLNKDPRFQGSGKKGCYALSVWELPYFGSNAEIVYQVLDEWDRPMKSEEIVEILTQRNYNSQFDKNDLSSVISQGKDKFCKLGKGYYGLVGRNYDMETMLPASHSFEADLAALDAYLDQHHHLPSTKEGEENARLRAWYFRRKKDWEGGNNWPEDKKQAFADLVDKCEAYESEKAGVQLTWNPWEDEMEAGQTDEQTSEASGEMIEKQEELPEETPATMEATMEEVPEVPEEIPETPEEMPDALLAELAEEELMDETVPATEDLPEPMDVEAEDEPVSVTMEQPLTEKEGILAAEELLLPVEDDTPEAADEAVDEKPVTEQEEESPIAGVPESLPNDDDLLWMQMLNRVRDFVVNNQREPYAIFTAEVELAEWLAAQKALMRQDSLSDERLTALLGIRNLLW